MHLAGEIEKGAIPVAKNRARMWIGMSLAVAGGALAVGYPPWPKPGVAAEAAADPKQRCSNADFKGRYALDRQGWLLTPSQVPYSEAGIVTFNGDGTFFGTAAVNVGGTVDTNVPFTGTYSVSSSCHISVTVFVDGSSPVHSDGVVSERGAQYIAIQTDSSAVVRTVVQKLK